MPPSGGFFIAQMKKIILAALLVPAIALAQTYPSPTFSSLTLQNPLTAANGGTGSTTSTGSGSVVLSTSPTLSGATLSGPTVTGSFTATGLVTSADLATQAANTVLANATASSASPTAIAIPSCNSATSALQWTSASGFACNSAVNAATLNGATFAAPGAIGLTTPGSAAFTTLTASSTATLNTLSSSGATITGGAISGTPISGSTGSFSTLSASTANPTLYYNQGGTGAVNITYQQKYQQHVNVADFGALCNGVHDDTSAINAAIASLGSSGGEVDFPAGRCLISSTINISANGIYLKGKGPNSAANGTDLYSTSLATGILNVTGSFITVRGFGFDYAGTPTDGSVIYSSGSYTLYDNFAIHSAFNGVEVTSGGAQFFTNFWIFNGSNTGFFAHSVNDIFLNNFIIAAGNATNGASGNISLANQVEAFTASNGDILQGVYSLYTSASSYTQGNRPAYNKFTNVYFDSATNGVTLNNAVEFGFSNCWFSGGRAGSGNPGLSLNNVDTIRVVNSEFFNNGGTGATLYSGAFRVLLQNNSFESNSVTAGVGAADGIAVAPGVTDFVIQGNVFHNGLYTGQQRYAVNVNTGASDRYVITNNLVSGNYTGGVADNGTGTHKNVSNNF
ncbi:glycosyl hydrolase family 28-related protein [Burkholderia multivorans]|uniref:glycosyl hydrolase family 28-related protein n=1 Tax=Burkholderia multivorans TaxID=87883 RepID=UPI000D4DB44D|nr:glycosyl hydrolase family 28-related protein [Burkholderia multivorans]MCL4627498.1 right-handed parallel beta-helix repeat-containing protein [Burkholderia multivorans]MCO1391005.1 right-handed parallel beta-helix repeat-containing protein [Burkholderia multivorans]MDN7432459.1 right-handed parallel beta-helix repeat-containing protein [Burkholderia multivorans]PRG88720.1 hypothetical protein C6T66_09825 [Burkholderia multivorans]UQO14892.1 right-handed parallel beta-helix repeat-containin